MLYTFTLVDVLAISWFFCVWLSYNVISKRRYSSAGDVTLSKLSRDYRKAWMLNMLDREYRIVDSTLLGTLMQSVSFFTSGTILLIAGLFAALGSAQDVLEITTQIPFAIETNLVTVKIKFLLLISLFVYVFFKLVWSLRQYNFAVVMMGGALIEFENNDEKTRYAEKIGIVLDRGGVHFNEGMRGYEFGLAYLAWFIHPLLLIATTTLVVLVIYRREFRSNILRAMQQWDKTK
jgi:uncharacterized membrane protein